MLSMFRMTLKAGSGAYVSVFAALSLALGGCGQLSAALHDPSQLPALTQDPRIHFEGGAEAYATAVGKMLPGAIARVEAAQGRPFGRPFVIVAFADDASYVAYNGRGSAVPPAVTYFGRVTLSPALWGKDRRWLEGDLTHELSHEHFFSQLSALDYYRIPVWFIEGIAVMVSDGGGAADVSAEAAMKAICSGRAIPVTDEPGWFNNVSLAPQPAATADEDIRSRMHMAYRQAGLFVSYLHDSNPRAFSALLADLYSGVRFKPALEVAYGLPLAQVWLRFVGRCPTLPAPSMSRSTPL